MINGISLRWTTGTAEVLLPISHEKNVFTCTFHGYPVNHSLNLHITGEINGKEVFTTDIKSRDVQCQTFTIEKKMVKKSLINLIQNAGNVVLSNGYSKDRGGILRRADTEYLEFYEEDSKFFNNPANLTAACGAAMLIKREVVDQIGNLDGHYFMYYEDVDFSLRAWKMGWDIVYAPKAKVYHAHRATTGKNESSFFINMTEKNHLLVVFTHFPLHIILQEYMLFLRRVGYSVIKQFLARFKQWHHYPLWRARATGRLDALLVLHTLIPAIVWKRLWWEKRYQRQFKQLKSLLY